MPNLSSQAVEVFANALFAAILGIEIITLNYTTMINI